MGHPCRPLALPANANSGFSSEGKQWRTLFNPPVAEAAAHGARELPTPSPLPGSTPGVQGQLRASRQLGILLPPHPPPSLPLVRGTTRYVLRLFLIRYLLLANHTQSMMTENLSLSSKGCSTRLSNAHHSEGLSTLASPPSPFCSLVVSQLLLLLF